MSYFLGVLSFALALNRTLVLPPFTEYRNIDRIKPVSKSHAMYLQNVRLVQLAPGVHPILMTWTELEPNCMYMIYVNNMILCSLRNSTT